MKRLEKVFLIFSLKRKMGERLFNRKVSYDHSRSNVVFLNPSSRRFVEFQFGVEPYCPVLSVNVVFLAQV